MKKTTLLLGWLAASCALTAYAAELPRKAAELSIALPDGGAVKISDYRGKVVVFAFILTT